MKERRRRSFKAPPLNRRMTLAARPPASAAARRRFVLFTSRTSRTAARWAPAVRLGLFFASGGHAEGYGLRLATALRRSAVFAVHAARSASALGLSSGILAVRPVLRLAISRPAILRRRARRCRLRPGVRCLASRPAALCGRCPERPRLPPRRPLRRGDRRAGVSPSVSPLPFRTGVSGLFRHVLGGRVSVGAAAVTVARDRGSDARHPRRLRRAGRGGGGGVGAWLARLRLRPRYRPWTRRPVPASRPRDDAPNPSAPRRCRR